MGYLCSRCGGMGGLFESSHLHSSIDACLSELKAEKQKLNLQIDGLQSDKAMLTGQLQQSRKHVADADRLNGVYRKALVDICSVVTIHDLAPDLARRVKDIAQKAYIDGEGQQTEKRVEGGQNA